MASLEPAAVRAADFNSPRGTDHWNLTAGVDENPVPHPVVDIHLRIELENDDVRKRLEERVTAARDMGSASMGDVKSLLRLELRRTGRDTKDNLALLEGLLLPLSAKGVLGTDIWNLLIAIDHNPSPRAVVDIHLRIELEDESVLDALNKAVAEARDTGDAMMAEAKAILVDELGKTHRDSEENLSLVNALLLP